MTMRQGVSRGLRSMGSGIRRRNDMLTEAAGGPARRRAIILLAAALGLSGADVGAIGALAPQLESTFGVGNAGIGLLVTVSSLCAALASLPAGVLIDRLNRTRLLSISVVFWGVAEVLSALVPSWTMLIVARLALGAVTSTAGPAVASLTGDLFPANERSRIYGMILTGEFLGAGIGVLVAGDIGAATSWRVGLGLLAIPSLLLAWAIRRRFPEPARGAQTGRAEQADDPHLVLDQIEDLESHVERSRVVHKTDLSLREAVRWLLRTPTNVSLIVASSLGYFFLSGLRTFALIYTRGRFGIGQGLATIFFVLIGLAAIAGVIVSGRLTDRWICRGRLDARLVVGGWGFLIATAALIPAFFSGTMWLGLPLFLIAGFMLSAPNPPIDAARLDVVPSRMWGRAEAVRTFFRTLLEAVAPLMFGLVSSALAGGVAGGLGSGINTGTAPVSHAAARGLAYTFLLMLVALAASGLMLLWARRHYLTDTATAAASEEEGNRSSRQGRPTG